MFHHVCFLSSASYLTRVTMSWKRHSVRWLPLLISLQGHKRMHRDNGRHVDSHILGQSWPSKVCSWSLACSRRASCKSQSHDVLLLLARLSLHDHMRDVASSKPKAELSFKIGPHCCQMRALGFPEPLTSTTSSLASLWKLPQSSAFKPEARNTPIMLKSYSPVKFVGTCLK